MKTLLAAINSQYVHSNTAVWYLKACCDADCGVIEVAEYNINDSPDSVLSDIFLRKPDIAAFSCYIWNIEYVKRLTADLIRILPKLVIILGGPEVSYDPAEALKEMQGAAFVLPGESELLFAQLLKRLNELKKNKPSLGSCGESDDNCLNGIKDQHRVDIGTSKLNSVYSSELCRIEDPDLVPSPFTDEMLTANRGKIVYFETSRGCPFACSYCLSSTIPGVRYFSMERVRSDLKRLMSSEVRQIKFVDRTFNASISRSHEIFSYIIENGQKAENNRAGMKNYHFEAYPDLLKDETIGLLSAAPAGLIQLECGIQSTNTETLKAVRRKTNSEKALSNIEKLVSAGNIHIHVDLVAGLPFEDLEAFKASFNKVYEIAPHNIQLGFLKLLKGTELRRKSLEYGYICRDYPPYEILRSGSMGFGELNLLKDVEEVLERYYNSGRFTTSLKLLTKTVYGDAFEFFRDISNFSREKGYLQRPQSGEKLYTILMDFLTFRFPEQKVLLQKLNELLKFDYLRTHISGQLPDGISPSIDSRLFKRSRSFFHDPRKIEEYLPDKKGRAANEIIRKVNFELFSSDVLSEDITDLNNIPEIILFDTEVKNPVTGHFNIVRVLPEDFE